MDLMKELDRFKREVAIRRGSPDQALLVLFAYATETAASRPPLLSYVEAVLGPPVQRASEAGSKIGETGKVDFKIVEVSPVQANQPKQTREITVQIDAATVRDINAMLAGNHPAAQAILDQDFDFSCGSEICNLAIHFDDGIFMVIAVKRGSDYIGIEHYLVHNGELLDTTGVALKSKSIIGEYESCSDDGLSNQPTHRVKVIAAPN